METQQAIPYLTTKNNTLISQGTYLWWKSLLSDVGPKMIYFIDNILIPKIDELCIQAFGKFYEYNRPAADLLPSFSENNGEKILSGFTFKIMVFVDIIKGFNGRPELIAQDEAFFINGLASIPGIEISENSAVMNTKKGYVLFSVKIPIATIG